jgi:glycosyltransferase involved in cell wall biosynthesis
VIRELPRVVHVASGREWRGGQRQVLLLAETLAKRSIDQVVITSAGSRLASELARIGVARTEVQWQRGLSLPALVATWRASAATRSILHAHDAHALIIAGLAGAATRSPVVATRRVDFHLRRPGFWARAARVIAVSEAVRRILIADRIAEDRITVVHSGIDLERTRDVRRDGIRGRLRLPETGPLAVSVAALVPHKDHRTLLRSAAILHRSHPDLHWALAGVGPERAKLEQLASDLGISPVIHFLGQVSEPLELIQAASVFVLSSAEEGLGTSVLDAMALGVPVVATRAGGIPEMLGHGAGVLVDPGQPEGLAGAISQVLTDPSVRQTVVASAAHEVQRFTADGMATGVLAVYRSVCLER